MLTHLAGDPFYRKYISRRRLAAGLRCPGK